MRGDGRTSAWRVLVEPQATLTQFDQRRRERAPLGNLGADPDVPRQGQRRVCPNGLAATDAAKGQEALLERSLAGGERLRRAVLTQRLLGHVGQEVAGVQRRIARAIEIQVEEV